MHYDKLPTNIDPRTGKSQARVQVVFDLDQELMQSWIDMILNTNHILDNDFCGRWLGEVGRREGSHLVWEYQSNAEGVWGDARRTWMASMWHAVPEHYHVLVEDTCIRAYVAGVQLWGVKWLSEADGWRMSQVLQIAMFGKCRYDADGKRID